MQEEQRPPLLDLEEALVADDDRSRRNEILETLVSEARTVKARLDRGLAPAEAAAAQRLLQALYAAHQTVRAVWRFHHHARGR
jgi:hypothetical protein